MMFFQKNLISFVLSGSIFAVCCTSVMAAATPETEQKNSTNTKTNTTVDAAKVYLDNCSICHGDNGDGNTRASSGLRPPPRDFTTVSAALELSRERMIVSVAEGRPGTGMMPHKDRISKAEIEAVVDYIRHKFMQTPSQAKKSDMSEHVEGEKVYGKNCSVCHGDKGTGALWARSGLNPQPRDFTTSEARKELNRERMIVSVANGRPGTAMMPHKDKLSKKEIEQVVDYIRAAYMSGPAAAASQAMPLQPNINPSQSQIARAHQGMSQGQSGAPTQSLPLQPNINPTQSQIARAHQGMSQTQPGAQTGVPHPGMPPMTGQQSGSRLPMPGATMPRDHTRTGRMPGQDPHQTPHAGGAPAMQARIGPVMAANMDAPMPKGLTGDVAKGRKFYMENCNACHGSSGEGNGPRAHFNTPRPRNFTSDASRRMLNRERLFVSITMGKVGTVMPAWGKVLNDQQIANVAEFVFKEFINKKEVAAASQKVSDEKKKAK